MPLESRDHKVKKSGGRAGSSPTASGLRRLEEKDPQSSSTSSFSGERKNQAEQHGASTSSRQVSTDPFGDLLDGDSSGAGGVNIRIIPPEEGSPQLRRNPNRNRGGGSQLLQPPRPLPMLVMPQTQVYRIDSSYEGESGHEREQSGIRPRGGAGDVGPRASPEPGEPSQHVRVSCLEQFDAVTGEHQLCLEVKWRPRKSGPSSPSSQVLSPIPVAVLSSFAAPDGQPLIAERPSVQHSHRSGQHSHRSGGAPPALPIPEDKDQGSSSSGAVPAVSLSTA